MMRFNRLPTLVLALCGAATLLASHPRHWLTSTAADFARGDSRGVAITSDGRLVLAPSLEELLDTGEAFVHDALLDVSGNLFLATGGTGKVFRVAPNGSSRQWAMLPESSVFALAVDSTNRLYAATSPDGKVYRIDGQGNHQVYFDPGEKFVWAMTFDAANNLYVATGARGVIYRVSPDGQSSVFYDSDELHVVSLAWDLDRRLVAGTAPGGLLLRFEADGSPFVLLDSALEEMRAVTVDSYGNVFAAALSAGESEAEEPAAEPLAADATVESVVTVPTGAKGGRVEIYRVDRAGLVDTFYSSSDQLVYDLLVRPDGSLLAATGDRGRILALSPDRTATILLDSPEQQITTLMERSGTLYATSANLGQAFRITPRPTERGVFESEVLDAGMSASWGRIRWSIIAAAADAPVLSTRSGNTAAPDETWSDWSEKYAEAAGSPVTSSPARYLQWKAEFPPAGRSEALLSETNAIDLVSISYLQRNAAPVLSELTVHAPAIALVQPPRANAAGLRPGGPDGAHAASLPPQIRSLENLQRTPPPRKMFVPGARSLSWKASDPNDDQLRFRVEVRRSEETRWTVLADGLARTHYTIDGASLADGLYFARVTATDGIANPPGQAARSRLLSKPFVVSNSAPGVEWGAASATSLVLTARTSGSPVYQVEYSVDGGPWTIVYPDDGIADSSRETYQLSLEGLAGGEHRVAVRVVDTVANVATAATTVAVP